MLKRTAYRFLTAISFAWLAWQIWLRFSVSPVQAQPYIDATVGDVLCDPQGKNWGSKGAFVFVGLATCPACSMSKPFEAELESFGREHGIPSLYVVSDSAQDVALSKELIAAGKRVETTKLAKIGITSVPAFIRVDGSGTIQSMWTNLVSEKEHDSVLAMLTGSSPPVRYKTAASAQLEDYASSNKFQLLALSQLGDYGEHGVTRIPVHDLSIRAPFELSKDLGVLIDCHSALSAAACQTAARILTQQGFPDVVALGLPSRRRTCP